MTPIWHLHCFAFARSATISFDKETLMRAPSLRFSALAFTVSFALLPLACGSDDTTTGTCQSTPPSALMRCGSAEPSVSAPTRMPTMRPMSPFAQVDASFFRDYLGDGLNASSYMVAGPPGMAAAATEALKTIGVDEHLISTDSFSGY